jgi:hypothetical protein
MRRQYCSGNIAALCVHAELIMLIIAEHRLFRAKRKKAEFCCSIYIPQVFS